MLSVRSHRKVTPCDTASPSQGLPPLAERSFVTERVVAARQADVMSPAMDLLQQRKNEGFVNVVAAVDQATAMARDEIEGRGSLVGFATLHQPVEGIEGILRIISP